GKEADIGIAGGEGVGILFKKGKLVRKVPIQDLMDVLITEVEALAKEKAEENPVADPARNGNGHADPAPPSTLLKEIPVLSSKR
ncbi:MAG TPA: 4-hydroxy-3-methylbut-2-en-1-yl diphosphate synthase, partial [Nitrospirales bacterium]|nr:4-hydroxy-3-methylbut-2-en-1-yl diphosphate synthase [Nitrospirales bacterium]